MEWFKLTKQRAPVRPEVQVDTTAPTLVPPMTADGVPDAKIPTAKVSIAKIPSPKTVFDNPANDKAGVKPAAKAGFTISSSKNGESSELQLTSPTLTVAKARMLFKSGWRVHITNATGRQFAPSEFDEILKFD